MGARIRCPFTLLTVLVLGLAFVAPAYAQTGQVKGVVRDANNKPVEGARVVIVRADGSAPKFEVKTKRNGDFIQAGIPTGDYNIYAEKDGLQQGFPIRVVGLDTKEVNFVLKPGGNVSKEEAAKAAARVDSIKKAFAEGAALSNEGKYDEAIVKFEEVLKEIPKCAECHANIGSVHTQKKDYEKAEASYKQALEISPELVDAYNGLATVYNAQKKFKEAQEMSAEAAKRAAPTAGGGNPDALYNQGVIAWNANDFQHAFEHFTNAVKADGNHAESHFMLGKVLINLGKLGEAATEFETYLKLAPSGKNATEAQTNFDALKGFRK
jgi:tetratricopeptide (TPR) repeat protein